MADMYGVLFYDVRRPTRLEPISISPTTYFYIKSLIVCVEIFYSCVSSFRSGASSSLGARFNDSGTRLLCNQRHLSQHVVFNLPMRHHQQPSAVNGKFVLKANDFHNRNVWHNQAYCFAGTDDELASDFSIGWPSLVHLLVATIWKSRWPKPNCGSIAHQSPRAYEQNQLHSVQQRTISNRFLQ